MPLATHDRRIAVRRARILRVALETHMNQLASPGMTRPTAEAATRFFVDTYRDAFERNVAECGAAFLTPADVERMGADEAGQLDGLLRFVFEETVAPDLKTQIRRGLVKGLPRDSELASTISNVRDALAPGLAPDGVDARLLSRTIERGMSTLIDEVRAIVTGDLTPIPAAKDLPRPTVPSAPPPPFLSYWKAFSDSKIAEGKWDVGTAANAAATPQLFRGLIDPQGQRSAVAVDRGVSSRFRAELLRLPRLYDKDRRFRELSLPEKLTAADRLDAIANARTPPAPQIPRLKSKTADKHFSNLLEYWKFLGLSGKIPRGLECPFGGFIQTKRGGNRAARADRQAWTPPKEAALWGSPVWQGCLSIHRRARPGLEIHRDALFWAPLIGRMTGLREDEICSLPVGRVVRVEDIEYPPGQTGPEHIWIFRIVGSKTPGSTRDIPLPQLLLDMGFLEYRVLGRAASEPLFPELVPQGISQTRGAALTGRFGDYRRKVGLSDERMDFHSLRATLATDLANLPGLNAGWADEITGHESDIRRSVRTLYVKGILLSHLKATLDHVRFRGEDRLPRFTGEAGKPAPDAKSEIDRYVALAQREMAKKAKRTRTNQNEELDR